MGSMCCPWFVSSYFAGSRLLLASRTPCPRPTSALLSGRWGQDFSAGRKYKKIKMNLAPKGPRIWRRHLWIHYFCKVWYSGKFTINLTTEARTHAPARSLPSQTQPSSRGAPSWPWTAVASGGGPRGTGRKWLAGGARGPPPSSPRGLFAPYLRHTTGLGFTTGAWVAMARPKNFPHRHGSL